MTSPEMDFDFAIWEKPHCVGPCWSPLRLTSVCTAWLQECHLWHRINGNNKAFMGENLIHNQKENPPKTQQKIYYDTGQTPVLYHYNRKTTTTKILEFNNPFTLLYVEELSHNQANVLKKKKVHFSHQSLTHRQNLRLRILNNTFTSSAKCFWNNPHAFLKNRCGYFFHPVKKTFSPHHVSNNNIQEAQKGVLQFGKLLICPFGHRERKKAWLWGEAMRRAAMRTTQDATSKVPIKRLPPSNRLMKPGSEIKSWRPDWIAASLHVHWIKF